MVAVAMKIAAAKIAKTNSKQKLILLFLLLRQFISVNFASTLRLENVPREVYLDFLSCFKQSFLIRLGIF